MPWIEQLRLRKGDPRVFVGLKRYKAQRVYHVVVKATGGAIRMISDGEVTVDENKVMIICVQNRKVSST